MSVVERASKRRRQDSRRWWRSTARPTTNSAAVTQTQLRATNRDAIPVTTVTSSNYRSKPELTFGALLQQEQTLLDGDNNSDDVHYAYDAPAAATAAAVTVVLIGLLHVYRVVDERCWRLSIA